MADSADIIGNVTLEAGVSIWSHVSIRGDNDAILIRRGTNIQEGSVLHVDEGCPMEIGPNVTVGHQAMLHGCTIHEGALVGMQAIVLNNAVIGRNCLIGAGAIIPEDRVIPDNSLVIGIGKIVRELSPRKSPDCTRTPRTTWRAANTTGPRSSGSAEPLARLRRPRARRNPPLGTHPAPAAGRARLPDRLTFQHDRSAQKYLFEDRSVRVQAVRLTDTWKAVRANHEYPPAITHLLGELVAASTLLAANIKFDGSLVLQIQGDGPIALLVVECRSDLSLRATVKMREGHDVPVDGNMQSLLNPGGNGRFIVVLDPQRKAPGQQAYQGIVPLEGDTVAEALQHYMKASEQLDTQLWLAADDEHAAGLLIQRLPVHGGEQAPLLSEQAAAETWERAGTLAATLKRDELLQVEIDTLIHRLYWEETLVAFDPLPVSWHCPCTRERVANMLRSLGEAEVQDIVAEHGQVDVTCDFCGKPYRFDAVDCAALFTPATPAADSESPTVH